MSDEFWCTRCLRCYKTKQIFLTHFEKKNVTSLSDTGKAQRGGKLLPNECFQSQQREFAKSKSEAELIQRQIGAGALSNFFQLSKKRRKDCSDCELPSASNDHDPVPPETSQPDDVIPQQISSPEVVEPMEAADTNVLDQVVIGKVSEPTVSSDVNLETIQEQLKMMEIQHQQILEMMEQLKMSTSNQQFKEASEKKIDQNLLEKKEYIERTTGNILAHAKSMKDIMLNPLVNERFHFVPLDYFTAAVKKEEYSEDELESECYLLCKICSRTSSKCGMLVVDREYACNYFDNLSPWFSRLKKVLRKHIADLPMHQAAVKELEKKEKEFGDVLDGTKANLRYLVYYIIKTNIAFLNYPTLLSTVFQCGLEIGNINHTRDFVSRILPLIDGVILENTKEWISDQQHITISLDIGTVLGLVLLVVYYIGSDGHARLAGCQMTHSKQGAHCAELCYKIACSNIFVDEALIQRKTKSLVADGAFADQNEPFKAKIREVFNNPNMIFRWDLLHLCNRAHLSARGMTQVDLDNLDEDERRRAMTRQGGNQPLVSLLMSYIQNESKQWRTGLAYTQLRLETLDFMRPKLFSSTRMCLYEYEQVKRFIEISHYFDVPWHWEVMCRLYLLILFAEKIILKTCQKTDDQREYVARVFMGNPVPEGKRAMVLGLRVAKDVIRGQPIGYLDTENLVNVLSTQPNVNHFVREMKKLVIELGPKLVPSSLQNTRGGTRFVQAITLPVIETALERFIDSFWEQFALRAARTDLVSGDTWCFSEAPCEAFFSKWGRIVHSRPSLLVDNVVRLIRIQLEGPPAGTDEAHSLMEAAMKQYRTVSYLGERYVTKDWVPGVISTTVRNVLNSPWSYSVYSNF